MHQADSNRSDRNAIGMCPTHGRIFGVKKTPEPSFPFVVYLARRAAARLGPYRCPECGARLQKVAGSEARTRDA